jgi:hypothetical protein
MVLGTANCVYIWDSQCLIKTTHGSLRDRLRSHRLSSAWMIIPRHVINFFDRQTNVDLTSSTIAEDAEDVPSRSPLCMDQVLPSFPKGILAILLPSQFPSHTHQFKSRQPLASKSYSPRWERIQLGCLPLDKLSRCKYNPCTY